MGYGYVKAKGFISEALSSSILVQGASKNQIDTLPPV
jgi:hypothetical protein